MKKLFLSIAVMSLFGSLNAQIDGFVPLFGQDAQWTVNENFELVFSGAVTPAPAAAIGTTFEGLVSDGIGGNDFTGLTITFDGIILDAATSTKVFLAYNGTWGEKAVNLEFNQWLCQAGTNYAFDPDITVRAMVTNFAGYQAAIKKNEYNKIEINVSATGLISCKVNDFVCDKPYQAELSALKPTETNTFYVVFGNDITGFKMKNLVATKGTTTNRYFYDPEAAISKVNDVKVSVYPNPAKATIYVKSELIGKKFEIKNILGQRVQEGIIDNANQLISIENQKSGNYLLVIDSENGKVVRSIIKQ